MRGPQAHLLIAGKWIVASVVAVWAGFPLAIHALIIFMGFDFLTGIVRAATQGKLSSEVSMKGLLKKAAMLLAVLFVHLMDGLIPQIIGFDSMELGLEKIFAIYLIFNEIISIVENLDGAGVKFPGPVVAALSKVKKLTPAAATEAEIDELTGAGDSTKFTKSKSTEIVKTPGSQPDLKVETDTSILEKKHVEPIPPTV